LSFDGIDDYVTVSPSATFTPTDQITLEVIFRTSDLDQLNATILSRKYDTGYSIGIGRDIIHELFAQLNVGGSDRVVTAPIDALSEDTWHHVALTYDGTAVRLYLDYLLRDTEPATGTIPFHDDDCLIIGGELYTRCTTQEGMFGEFVLREARISNRALVPDEFLCVPASHCGDGLCAFDEDEFSCVDDCDGLIGYWNFDEGDGTTALDSSGYGNDGTVNRDAVYSLDIPLLPGNMSSVLLNGSSESHVTIADVPEFDFNSADARFSVQAWVNFTGFPPTSTSIASKYGAGGTRRGWSVGTYHDYLQLVLSENGLATDVVIRSTNTFVTDTWYHIVFTIDIHTDHFEIYVNGELLETENIRGTTIDTINPNTAYLTIGAQDGTGDTGDTLTAYIDEVRIYDRVRSAEEILAEYEALCGDGSCRPE
jgi:hypothetical protein